MKKQEYSLGFAFSEDLRQVLLIKKLRSPKLLGDKMIGKLNGIGGHVERNESGYDCMVRESKEETGLDLVDWNYYCCLEAKFGKVYCFYTVTDDIYNFGQQEDEELMIYFTGYNPKVCSKFCYRDFNRMFNLDYLIPMAINHYKKLDDTEVFTVIES
jgi:8-oxo-dGTP diphosphatase